MGELNPTDMLNQINKQLDSIVELLLKINNQLKDLSTIDRRLRYIEEHIDEIASKS